MDGNDVVIVDSEWAEEAFAGRSPVGRRIRFPGMEGEAGQRWHEVVGVVEGIAPAIGPGEDVGIYRPLRADEAGSLYFWVRTEGLPAAFTPEVQDLVSEVAPVLTVEGLMPLRDVWRPVERSGVFFTWALGVMAGVLLLFALMGMYALVSFTVERRAREIGIRAAMGASPRAIVTSIFSRAMIQIGLGIVLGGGLVASVVLDDAQGRGVVGAVALAMALVGLAACVVPARRALRIDPIEALRPE